MLSPSHQPNLHVTREEYVKFSRLGGWLLFFVISAILSEILIFTTAVRELMQLARFAGWIAPHVFSVFVVGQLIVFVSVVLACIGIGQIFSRKPHFLLFDQLGYMIYLLGIIVGTIIPLHLLGAEYSLVMPIVQLTLGMLLRTLYFCKSRRVRTYMGHDGYMDKALIKFRP